jgi:methanogenic corrinoid protein MtbC1
MSSRTSTRPAPPAATLAQALQGWWLSSMHQPRRRSPARRPHDGQGTGDDECRRSMRGVLEDQIIPRLLVAHRDGAVNARPSGRLAAHVATFAGICAAGDRAAADRLVARLRAEGHGADSVMVDLVGPAALLLGREWEDDRRSFVDVTLGLVLMHEIIHTMGYEYRDGPKQAGPVRRVMLASAPGSQHVLGLSIVSEFFRKAGWQVVLEVSPSSAELCHAVKNEWFDLVGLSVALDTQLSALPALIGQLKAASHNPAMPVLLGGPVFTLSMQQAERFGAAAICLDAREAVDTAIALVAR